MKLQLFKKNNIEALYKKVDDILEKNRINPFFVNKDLKTEATLLRLTEMNKSKHFSICAVRDVFKMHEVKVPTDRMDFYHSLHCVDWGDMSVELRESLNAMIFKDLEHALRETV